MRTRTYRAESVLVDAIFSRNGLAAEAVLLLAFSLLTALCAQVALPLPFTPVPITGQTFAVLLSGALLGSRRAALSQALYLAEGLAGLPVFAPFGPPGLARLLGPTGGYLMAYVPAAFIVGWFADRGWSRNPARMALALALGSLTIHAGGLFWQVFGLNLPMDRALALGFYPFLIGDAIKATLVALLVPAGWMIVERK